MRPAAFASGQYYFVLPKSPPGPRGYPVVVHLHGWSSFRASGDGTMRVLSRRSSHAAMSSSPPSARFSLQAAATGLLPTVKRGPRRDDAAFLSDVLDDAVKRLKIDRSRVLLTGFSRGGSMVWDVACQTPGAFTAYAAVGGGFWNPLPQLCKGSSSAFSHPRLG